MGKKTGCTRPRATKSSKNKLTQKKTHSQKTSSLMYLNGSQTSPKSKNSQTAIYYEDSQEPPSSQTKSSELRKAEAIHLLSGCEYPKHFRHRQRQLIEINTFVVSCLKREMKGCRFLMITGAPGLGKTLSVTTILSRINCLVISLNSNVIRTLKEVQDIIYENLMGYKSQKSMTTAHIIRQLIAANKTEPVFVYIEEIQTALSGFQSDYDIEFLSLFSNKQLNVNLIGVSNSIDALEKYNEKVCSLYHVKNIVFAPYDYETLKKIILDRLSELNQRCQIRIDIVDKLLNYVTRKLVLLTKGDMRLVNDFIKELASTVINEQHLDSQQEECKQNFQFSITIDTLDSIFSGMEKPKDGIIQKMPFTQQLLLRGISQILQNQDSLYVSEERVVSGITRACSDAGLFCSKIRIKQWLDQLQCYDLIKIDDKKDPVRITLCVDRKYIATCANCANEKQLLRAFLIKPEERFKM